MEKQVIIGKMIDKYRKNNSTINQLEDIVGIGELTVSYWMNGIPPT